METLLKTIDKHINKSDLLLTAGGFTFLLVLNFSSNGLFSFHKDLPPLQIITVLIISYLVGLISISVSTLLFRFVYRFYPRKPSWLTWLPEKMFSPLKTIRWKEEEQAYQKTISYLQSNRLAESDYEDMKFVAFTMRLGLGISLAILLWLSASWFYYLIPLAFLLLGLFQDADMRIFRQQIGVSHSEV